MFVFKTSGRTIGSVVANQKHAFVGQPTEWYVGETILVSKNLADCNPNEKQIQYVMKLRGIRPLQPGEAQKYWPGTEGRWRYLVECSGTHRLRSPFNLVAVLGQAASEYRPVITFKRCSREHERLLLDHLRIKDADAI